MSSTSLLPSGDIDLEAYFTDVEYLRELFARLVTSKSLTKNLLVIHGFGGIGKTSLLRMFCLRCRQIGIPFGLASGEVAKSPVEILSTWASDLSKLYRIKLPAFDKSLRQLLLIQAKVEEHARKAEDSRGRLTRSIGKGVAKTAIEIATGYIPVIGPILSVLGGTGIDVLTDWLGGFLAKKEIDLLLDPTARLTDEFLSDIARSSTKQRLVLMLDTFEQIGSLSDWAQKVAKELHSNTLLVIAGRAIPSWGRQWPSWMAHAEVHELVPMTNDIMRDLITRYYRTIRGSDPDPAQIDVIVQFARGMPLVVTSAVQLWVQHNVTDFEAIKPQVGADLVDRLLEGIPHNLRAALEAAATLRWFNRDLLSALLDYQNIDIVYEDLRRFPFISVRSDGLTLHSVIREILDEYLRYQAPDHYHRLHEKAAIYFSNESVIFVSHNPERARREWLFHSICADENSGLSHFQTWAEELAKSHYVAQLRILVNEINVIPLYSARARAWREYYSARLTHAEGRSSEAEDVYTRISESANLEPKLRAYALIDLSQVLTGSGSLAKPSGVERALQTIALSQSLFPDLDSKVALGFLYARYAHMHQGQPAKAVESLNQLLTFFEKIGDENGKVYALEKLKDLYGLLGDWQAASKVENEGIQKLKSRDRFLYARIVGHNNWHKVWSGRYADAEVGIREALELAEKEDQRESLPGLFRDLGLIYGLQRRWRLAYANFNQSAKKYKEWNPSSSGSASTLGFWGATLARNKEFRKARPLLESSLDRKKKGLDNNGIPELLVWLGELSEMIAKVSIDDSRQVFLSQAENFYKQCLEYRWTSRIYFECAALTGLMRVQYASGRYDDASQSFSLAEQLGQKMQYQDLLGIINLYRGHLLWLKYSDRHDEIFQAYSVALSHATLFNRFLLDDIIVDNSAASPLQPIATVCELHGERGRQLLNELRKWWHTATFQLPTNIDVVNYEDMLNLPMRQLEETIRQKEPGDGLSQDTVEDRLEVVKTL